MKDMTPAHIVKTYDALEGERSNIKAVWDRISHLVFPFRGEMYTEYTNEQVVDWLRNRNVFDSTAIYAAGTLASSIHGALTNPSLQWFEIVFRDDELNKDKEAMDWLQSSSERCYQALVDSNFDLEVSEMYLDLVGFGTSVIVEEVEDDLEWSGLQFQTIPINDCQFMSDHMGHLLKFFRRYKWTALQIVDKFGIEGLPEDIVKMYQDDVLDRLDVIFCIYDRGMGRNVDVSKPLTNENKPFAYKYIYKKDKTELKSGGYYEMPSFAVRWRKMAGSQLGFSPTMTALPDIETLNDLVRMGLTALEKVIDPMIMAEERAMISDLDLGSKAVNVVRKLDGIAVFESKSNFQVEFAKEDRLQQSIREAFHANELQLKDSPEMSATEASIRYELMNRLLGPTLGRIKTDFLDPLIQTTFNLMQRAGQLEEPPESVLESQSEFDITYVGPLSRSMQSDKADTIDRWIGGVAQFAELDPQAMDVVDMDGANREKARLFGTSAKAIRAETGENSVEEIRQARQQKQEMAEQLQQAEQGAGAIKDIGGVDALKSVGG